MKPTDLPALTSLRFFAAAVIVIYHLSALGFIDGDLYTKFQLSNGVSFFYVLSGFILQHSYSSRMATTSYREFMFMRIARIWPLHIAVVIIILCAGLFSGRQFDGQNLFLVVTLMQSWLPDPATHFGINGVSWSISNELFFYAMFPLSAWLVRRSAIGLFVVIAAILPIYFSQLPIVTDEGVRNGLYAINPISRLPEFLLGVLICHLGQRWILSSGAPRSMLWTIAEISTLISIVALNVAIVSISNFVYQIFGHGTTVWFYSAGTAPAFCLCILVFAIGRGYISRLLSNRVLVFLGEISFSLYLVHQQLIMHFKPTTATDFILLFVTMFVCSVAGWALIEKPCMRWVRSRVDHHKVQRLRIKQKKETISLATEKVRI